MEMKQFLAVFVLAACLMHTATAVRCYQCKSLTDPDCAKEKLDSSSTIRQVDCNTIPKPNVMGEIMPVTKCNKVVTSDKAGVIISRDCHFEVVGESSNTCLVSHSREVKSCHICQGDLCNASSAGRFFAMGMAALISIVLMQFAL